MPNCLECNNEIYGHPADPDPCPVCRGKWMLDERKKKDNMTYEPNSEPFESQWSYPSITYHHYVGHHSMFLIVAYDLETNRIKFLDMKGGKPDPCETAYREALVRVTVIAFDNGATIDEVADSLQGITCVPESNNEMKGFIHSPADYLAKCLVLTQQEMVKQRLVQAEQETSL